MAIEETVKQGFKSGVHTQIMGAGKSIIILNIINRHYKGKYYEIEDMPKDYKPLYIYLCDKTEILDKMFFKVKDENNDDSDINDSFDEFVNNNKKEGKKELDKAKVKDWKYKNIIDLNEFSVIDCVNEKPKSLIKHIKDNRDGKPVILVINNDFLISRKFDSLDIDLVLFDECHCVSGPEFYEVLKKIKYDKKVPIIGFSATPLRDGADKKLCDIFSKDKDKKLNVISTYDLIDAMHDGIVLPFKLNYVEIENIDKNDKDKFDEIKEAKDMNMKITQKTLDKIMRSLPYKKILSMVAEL